MQEVQGIQELAQWVQQIAAMKQQYDQLVSTYNALAHVTDLSSAAYALGGLTRNYMPEANAIPDLMTDVANLWGRAGYFNSYDLYYASRRHRQVGHGDGAPPGRHQQCQGDGGRRRTRCPGSPDQAGHSSGASGSRRDVTEVRPSTA